MCTHSFPPTNVSILIRIFILWSLNKEVPFAQAVCTVCKDASAVAIPDKVVAIPDLASLPCGSLDALLEVAISDESSDECQLVQSLGSLCGCPAQAEKPCSLCESEIEMLYPEKVLSILSPFLFGVTPTCELFDAYLHSTEVGSEICAFSHAFAKSYCGCPESLEEEEVIDTLTAPPCQLCGAQKFLADPTAAHSFTELPFATCGSLDDAAAILGGRQGTTSCFDIQSHGALSGCQCHVGQLCDLCGLGYEVEISRPNRRVSPLTDHFGFSPTCSDLMVFAQTISTESIACSDLHWFGAACGCPNNNGCDFSCNDDDASIPEESREKAAPDQITAKVLSLDGQRPPVLRIRINCEFMEFATQSIRAPGDSLCVTLCETTALYQHECGCDGRFIPCQFCADGDAMQYPEREMLFLEEEFGYIPTCSDFEQYVENTIHVGDTRSCQTAHFLTQYCGCARTGPLYPCMNYFHCSDERPNSIPEEYFNKTLEGEFARMVRSWFNHPHHAETNPFQIKSPTCGSMFSVLAQMSENDSHCHDVTRFQHECGCDRRFIPCKFCPHGDTMEYPDREMPFFKKMFGYVPTCSDFSELVNSEYDDKSILCEKAYFLATYCGCTTRLGTCLSSDLFHCTEESDQYFPEDFFFMPLPPEIAEWVERGSIFGSAFEMETPPNCGVVFSYLYQSSDIVTCGYVAVYQHVCGCDRATGLDLSTTLYLLNNFGTTTQEGNDLHIWLSRSASILSIIGTVAIMQDVLRDRSRRKNLYNQIVFLMSCFDFIFSLAWLLSRLPLPAATLSNDLHKYYYGAKGTTKTCTAQGFFFQLGMTSIFFNVSLSTYFLLTIVHSYKASSLRKLRPWFLLIPVTVGMVLACAGIPYYSSVGYVCHLSPPVESGSAGSPDTWGPFLGLFLVPGWAVVTITTGLLLRVYLYVRKLNKKASKWSIGSQLTLNQPNADHASSSIKFGSSAFAQSAKSLQRSVSTRLKRSPKKPNPSKANSLQKEVFWQGVAYLTALYVSWTIILVVSQKTEENFNSRYWVWATMFFLVPLQGFNNALVYFRPRMVRRWALYQTFRKKKRAKRNAERQQQKAAAEGDGVNEFVDDPQQHTDSNSSPDVVRYARRLTLINAMEPAADLVREDFEFSEDDLVSDSSEAGKDVTAPKSPILAGSHGDDIAVSGSIGGQAEKSNETVEDAQENDRGVIVSVGVTSEEEKCEIHE